MSYMFALYTSQTKGVLPPDDIAAILKKSEINNRQFHITGFLHYDNARVVQYLEGPRGAVQGCLARIAKDRRHWNFRIIADGDIDKRMYQDWSMGALTSLREADLQRIIDADSNDPFVDEDIMDLLMMFAMRSGAADDDGGVDISVA